MTEEIRGLKHLKTTIDRLLTENRLLIKMLEYAQKEIDFAIEMGKEEDGK